MSRRTVLVLLDAADPGAESFRKAVGGRAGLYDEIDLQFASAANAAAFGATAEILACGSPPPQLLDIASQLKWIAYWSAGLDGKITPQILSRDLLLTNASGVHGPNIAEHVLAFMLMFTRRMEIHLRSQIRQVWDRRMPAEQSPSAELTGQTLGIIGYGRIGEALTIRARAFGMRVIAIKRDTSRLYSADPSLQPDALSDMTGLKELLAESDHVCIALPATPETYQLINEESLACMKPTAYLYNIARGSIVDEAALVRALQNGGIAGAGLDVFEQEPLPPDSPLWQMENVILTPHVSGLTPHYFDRFAEIFTDNLERYLTGVPLNNLYSHIRGY